MTVSFSDTLLPRDELVEKAFDVLCSLYKKGGEVVRDAVRCAELLASEADNPPPAAIALCLLAPGQWSGIEPSVFAAPLGPDIAASLERLYEYDFSKGLPSTLTEDERLAAAAMTMHRMSALAEALHVQGAQFYEGQRKKLKDAEKILLAVVRGMEDRQLARAATFCHMEASRLLAKAADAARAEFDFEKTGLPDHPAIRAVHAHVKEVLTTPDPDSAGMAWGIRIAKMVADSGAQPDPDVICAALMNGFSCVTNELPACFNDRTKHLYRQTSDRHNVDPREEGEDIDLIRDAAHCLTLETMIDDYTRFAASPHAYPGTVKIKQKLVGQFADRLAPRALAPQPAPLRERMEKALKEAAAITSPVDAPADIVQFIPNGF